MEPENLHNSPKARTRTTEPRTRATWIVILNYSKSEYNFICIYKHIAPYLSGWPVDLREMITFMNMYMYVCLYTYVHTHTYVYVYIYTHIYICSLSC